MSAGVPLASPSHHPVFARFREAPRPEARDEFLVDFLGTVKRKSFDPFPHTQSLEFNEEYFEWIDLLEAAVEAEDGFTMVELGAGFGRWLVRAAYALRQCHPGIPIRLVGVEADPTHFQWMHAHFRDNGLDPAEHRLIEAAVDAREGEVAFLDDSPYDIWGQHIVRDPGAANVRSRRVRAVTLGRLLEDLPRVDLIDLDVQGAEAVVLESAARALARKVKRVHVGTHTHEIEQALRTLFTRLGWEKRHDFPCLTAVATPYGEIRFGDGVQTWLNPALRRHGGGRGGSIWARLRRALGR